VEGVSKSTAAELCGLNLDETDLARGTTWIKGKGKREKELLPLPTPVVQAIRRYLRWRGGTAKGPLFLTRSGRISASGEHRLQTRSVLRIVRVLGPEGGPARLVSLAPAASRRPLSSGRRPASGWIRSGRTVGSGRSRP
jgi:site-specific recombinase XerC